MLRFEIVSAKHVEMLSTNEVFPIKQKVLAQQDLIQNIESITQVSANVISFKKF